MRAWTTYGGLGGVYGGRTRNTWDEFENSVERCLGEAMRADESLCQELWGSLANVEWQHTNGATAGYSFRAAGDLIAAVIGCGDYMDWYCSAPDGRAFERIREALATEGWTPIEEEE